MCPRLICIHGDPTPTVRYTQNGLTPERLIQSNKLTDTPDSGFESTETMIIPEKSSKPYFHNFEVKNGKIFFLKKLPFD